MENVKFLDNFYDIDILIVFMKFLLFYFKNKNKISRVIWKLYELWIVMALQRLKRASVGLVKYSKNVFFFINKKQTN